MASVKRTLVQFLTDTGQDWDLEGKHGRAADPYHLILEWAESADHGALPRYSAQPFANWLNNVWGDWAEDPTSVKEILEGAMTDWCGGRAMPS